MYLIEVYVFCIWFNMVLWNSVLGIDVCWFVILVIFIGGVIFVEILVFWFFEF